MGNYGVTIDLQSFGKSSLPGILEWAYETTEKK